MTVKEAQELLKTAPSDDTPCRINNALTTKHFTEIMVNSMASQEKEFGLDYTIKPIFEKRIYQCIRNQRRPRY